MSNSRPAALDNIWYASDPQDGASVRLLSDIGVGLHRKGHEAQPSGSAFSSSQPLTAENARESTADQPLRYTCEGGSVVVDVRDSADAWLRLLLVPGDSVEVGPSVKRRVFMRDSDSTGTGNTSL